jgi:hypothetical protein
MKKSDGIFLSTLVALGLSCDNGYAGKASPVCSNNLITIAIIQDPLNFASLTPCLSLDGTLEIRTNGGTKVKGCIDGTSGSVNIARVRVGAGQADKKADVTVTLPTNQMIVSNGLQTMTITDINMKPGGQSRNIKGTATETFDIGGTLNVDANQVAGTYTGNFTVNAECVE